MIYKFFNIKRQYVLLFAFFSLISTTASFAQNGAQLDILFANAGQDATYWFVDVRMRAGTNYVTNNSDYGTVNALGSFTSINLRYTTVGVAATSAIAPTIITNFTAVSGITSGNTTFLSAGGCYVGQPVYNISISRAAPAPDASAVPLTIGTLSFPKATFPAGVIVTVRPTTTPACASRETFWSNPANLPDRQLMGGNTYTLPLRLLSFTATEKNCNASIAWKTAGEVNASYFELQVSKDGASYKTIASVPAKGGAGNYNTTMPQATAAAYYRLKMVDKEGKFTYSDIVPLTIGCQVNDNMSIYPNPVANGENALLSFNTSYKGMGTITITNTLGQQVAAIRTVIVDGVNNKSIATNKFASGMYYVTLVNDTGNIIGATQKLIKQ